MRRYDEAIESLCRPTRGRKGPTNSHDRCLLASRPFGLNSSNRRDLNTNPRLTAGDERRRSGSRRSFRARRWLPASSLAG